MEPTEGTETFQVSGRAYDTFMGRYSQRLAPVFADAARVAAGDRVLDVGCGPGALTGHLVDRLGASAVTSIDPTPPFVAACAARFPTVDVRLARAEEIPFADDTFDGALAQLVLHFVRDPERAAAEMARVVRPGGTVAACVWDFSDGMEMLRHFWDAAVDVVPSAPDEARVLRFGGPGEITDLLLGVGLDEVVETTLTVDSAYSDFDELWSGFLEGIGPAGSFCVSLSDEQREEVRAGVFRRLGEPGGPFSLLATARCATGRTPPAPDGDAG